MIEVDGVAIIERQVFQVAIVRVLLNENHFARADRFKNAIGDRRLARTRAAANTDNHKAVKSEK